MLIVGIIILYAGILAIIPLIIHGSYRYKMSGTSWRGIRFGYRGDKATLYKKFFVWMALTIVTLGIYGAWMQMHMRNYVLGNVRIGNMKFKYKGNKFDFFILNLLGYLLTIITLGIYGFWWQKVLFAYYVDNLSLAREGAQIKMKSIATGGDFFALIIVNVLILIFTLGLGYTWVVTRTTDFVCSHIKLKGDINFDELAQTEDNFTDAMAEDMGDMLNIDFIF